MFSTVTVCSPADWTRAGKSVRRSGPRGGDRTPLGWVAQRIDYRRRVRLTMSSSRAWRASSEPGSKARDELASTTWRSPGSTRVQPPEARRRGLKVGVPWKPSSLLVGARSLPSVLRSARPRRRRAEFIVIRAASPDPRAYQAIAEALGVSTTSCLFFDDIAAKVEGARCAEHAFRTNSRRRRSRFVSLKRSLDGAGP